MQVKLENNEVVLVDHTGKTLDLEVASNFFANYPAPCWVFDGTELVLKDTADAIKAELLTPVPEVPTYNTISVIAFKMAFTAQERIAIKTSPDLVVQDFYELIQDPRTTEIDLNLQTVQDALNYMVTLEVLTPERVEVILSA